VAALAGRAKIAAVADDALLVEALGAAARGAGTELSVLVDLDLGQHRTGVRPLEALGLARRIAATDGLRFTGLQGYVGHLQHIAEISARLAANVRALAVLAALKAELTAAGLPLETISGGGTGTHTSDLQSGVFTELQAGSYAVMDAEYGACGAPGGGAWPFEMALVLASSVVSARHRTHVTVDAGLKALSVDGPPARVIAGAAAGSVWRPMGDEHGAIFQPAALEALRAAGRDPLAFEAAIDAADAALPILNAAPSLGGAVWLQPGHCDPTVNLYDAFLVAEPDGSWSRWPIDARRTTPGL
jgi:D-serine deaminase-like pyridoxal phosphate-dependent protein